ncbi:MAG: zinc-ribbon domain-containing protein [Clostridia bacterium]|nr:zinc-ribbon domain-containing protein [Clostridia bacterium]
MDSFFDKVKTNFGKAMDGAEKYSKIAAQKTSGIISQTKYSFAINEAENKMVSVLAEIGEYVYSEFSEGAEFPADIAAKCAEIDALKEEIASLKEKIAELKESVVCPSCGEYNSSENSFCGKCGAKLRKDD